MKKGLVLVLMIMLCGVILIGCSRDKADVEKAAMAFIKTAFNVSEVPLKGEPTIIFDDTKMNAAIEMRIGDGTLLTLLCVKRDDTWTVVDCASVPAR